MKQTSVYKSTACGTKVITVCAMELATSVVKSFPKLFFSVVLLIHIATANGAPSPSCLKKDLTKFFGGIDNEDYIAWATTVGGGCVRYENYVYLSTTTDTSVGSAIHWKVDESNSMVYLAVAVQIDTPDRWVAFGISEVGGMFGSDLAFFESSKPTLIQDGYIQDERQPFIDTKPLLSSCTGTSSQATSDSNGNQDWNYVNVTSTETFLVIEMSRALITGDSFDFPIINDRTVEVPEQRIIVAWGTSSTISYHGPNKVRGAIRWFSETSNVADFHSQMLQKADGYVDFIVPNYTIPNVETTYASFCFFYEDYEWPESTHIIGYDAIIRGEVGRTHIHHYLFEGSRVTRSEVTDCFNYLPNSELMWPWGPGLPGFDFPDYLTVSAGPKSASKLVSFRIQIHYDNPNQLTDLVDSSGVRLYYSSKARTHEAAMFVLGDPNVGLQIHPLYKKVGKGLTEHSFTCPGGCTNWALNQGNVPQNVTIVREHLHMHQKGTAIRNDLIRGDTGEIVHTGRTDYWDFKQQGGPSPIQVPFQVQPGDVFKLTCYYSNEDGELMFGIGTQQEMCMAFLMYYPRLDIPDAWVCGFYTGPDRQCYTSYSKKAIDEKANIPRSFSSAQCSVKTESGRCPESYRCTGIRAAKVSYSVTRRSLFRDCVSRCVTDNMIPLWRIRGYRCGACP